MRVNISYSAELDEVPAELSRIIVDTARRLEATATALTQVENLLTASTAVNNAQEVADLINAGRNQITQVDTRLAESISILGGYFQAKTDPESLVPQGIPSADAAESVAETLTDTVEELSAQLAESREELEELVAGVTNGVSQTTEAAPTEEADDAKV